MTRGVRAVIAQIDPSAQKPKSTLTDGAAFRVPITTASIHPIANKSRTLGVFTPARPLDRCMRARSLAQSLQWYVGPDDRRKSRPLFAFLSFKCCHLKFFVQTFFLLRRTCRFIFIFDRQSVRVRPMRMISGFDCSASNSVASCFFRPSSLRSSIHSNDFCSSSFYFSFELTSPPASIHALLPSVRSLARSPDQSHIRRHS